MIYSYRRVSTDEQHLGPQAQADAITRWGASGASGAIIADFCDIGVSGSVPFADRPEGSKLATAIEQDAVPPTIVVAKLDRMFRSVADAAVTLAHWDKIGVKLVSIGEGFDMTNPYGRAMAQMASVFAELEREMIRQRTKAGIAAKQHRGGHVGRAPYGYTSLEGEMYELALEQETMRVARECRAAGMKLDDVCAKLDSMGYVTRTGAKWTRNVLHKILARNLCNSRSVAG